MYIFITSILSISCIILHMVKVFHIKIKKNIILPQFWRQDQQLPPPKRHIDFKRGNVSMDVPPN